MLTLQPWPASQSIERWLPVNYRYETDDNLFRLPDYYHVSSLGRIKNTRTRRILKQAVTGNGYKMVAIYDRHFTVVHCLVAMAYVNNPDPTTRIIVDHKDGNRQYNVGRNLQWVTYQQNTEKYLGIQVIAIPVDAEGNHGEPLVFPSATQATRHSFRQTRGAIPSSTMNSYLNSGKVLYGHIFRRMGGSTDDESAGPGFDLQNRGIRSVLQRRLWEASLPTSELRETQAEQQAAIAGEVWRPARIVSGDSKCPLPATGYEVSDQGRVRDARSGFILRNQFNRTRNVVGNLRWATPGENTIADSRSFAFNDTTFPLSTIQDHMASGIPLQGWFFVREAALGAEGLHVNLGGPEYKIRGIDDIVLIAFNNDANQREDQSFFIQHDGDETNNRLNSLQRANYEQYHQADDRQRVLLGFSTRRILRSRKVELQCNPMLFY
ncbi:hypothetical protein MBANPS3_000820 [Mucor bainieri]